MATGDTREESRLQTLTKKGLEYQMDRKSKYRRACEGALVALSDNIQQLLITSTDANEVKELHKKWLKAYDELLYSHESFQDLLKQSSEDEEKDDKEFQERNKRFQEVKDSVEQWFAKHARERTPSQVSFDAKSVKSRRSHSSKASSQISLEKLKEGQRKAELLAKASALDEQRKLEAAKLELKMKEEELKIKTELKISDARTRLLEELERSELHDQQLENSLINENQDRNVTFHLDPMNALASEISTPNISHRPVPHIGNSALLTPIQDFKPESTSEIQTVARELNKPKAEIQKFDGNPMNYTKFLRQFNARICSNTDSYEELLNFLLQFTVGEAQKIVTGYSYLDAERGYKAALEELKDRYGDPDIIAQAYVKKALDWPVVKQENAKDLDQFAIFLRECQYAVENIDAGRVLEYSENLKLLVKKLPFYLHDKWRNCVYDLKEKKLSVKFYHLVDFVRKEAKKATDPIYGKEMMSTPSTANKRLQDHKKSETRKNFTVKTDSRSMSDNSATQMKTFSRQCIYCKGAHSLDMCLSITILPLRDRYAFLKTNGLCFSCLKSGHLKTNCRQKMSCAHCNKSHPSILHVDPRQNEEPNTATREYKASETPLSATYVIYSSYGGW
ncbi:CAP-Gly domain-containing linker protein 1-like [Saccostrea cucullata]|uniref:CAP-Gly domain-containing linker protein 1-like n=1 Tax=Saccostrea cuccullata TaxID=36930 RepID=UPI002ED473D6